MRTVICHFYNEAYLLPWWLKHHTKLFDFGVMIDHGSTDASCDILRQLAPEWRLVRSRLTCFDAYLTDLEVMSYEQELPGWKIALNATEFLMATTPLVEVEKQLVSWEREGCSASGFICVDNEPENKPDANISLPLQKHWGIDDNAFQVPAERVAHGLSPIPVKNRFYHRRPVGMYYPGRHASFHHDSQMRVMNLMIFAYSFSPWNEEMLQRKLQIKNKISPDDIKRNWGEQHLRDTAAWDAAYQRVRAVSSDLCLNAWAKEALQALSNSQ